MQKLILLVVGAAWVAVLVPPLLRSRMDNRPSTSVTDFRRQLSNLQRTMPARGGSPMRAMTRPLVPGAPRPGSRQHGTATLHRAASHTSHPGSVSRIHAASVGAPGHRAHAQVHLGRAPSRRELVRQRRRNVLFGLVVATAGSLFLAFTTKSDWMIYLFVLAAVSLTGYCYKLVQLRRAEELQHHGSYWSRAA
jgi:hypothetical protein